MHKVVVRLPAGTLVRRNLLHHLVHLLQSQPFCLWNEEVGKEYTGCAGRAPYKEDFGTEVPVLGVDDVGDNDGCS
jgi:hypothetical protein